MVSDDGAQPRRREDMVALLDPRGRVVWCLTPPRRVTRSWTCGVAASGVTLYRWPLGSIFVPLERVDRFDVLREQHVFDDFGHPLDAVERLALLTTAGKWFWATGLLNALVSCRFGLPHASRAQQLNNHILAIRRAGRGQPAVHGHASPTVAASVAAPAARQREIGQLPA